MTEWQYLRLWQEAAAGLVGEGGAAGTRRFRGGGATRLDGTASDGASSDQIPHAGAHG